MKYHVVFVSFCIGCMSSVLNEIIISFRADSRHILFISFCDDSIGTFLNDKFVY